LEKKGLPLEIRDVFVGAQAKIAKLILITKNKKHFERIPNSKFSHLENFQKKITHLNLKII
jgi:predicted nucleic acid-binding protein